MPRDFYGLRSSLFPSLLVLQLGHLNHPREKAQWRSVSWPSGQVVTRCETETKRADDGRFYKKEASRSVPFTRLSSVMKMELKLILPLCMISPDVSSDVFTSLPVSQSFINGC